MVSGLLLKFFILLFVCLCILLHIHMPQCAPVEVRTQLLIVSSLFSYCWCRISLGSSQSIPGQLALVSRWFFPAPSCHHRGAETQMFDTASGFFMGVRGIEFRSLSLLSTFFPTEHLDSLIFSSWGFKWVTWFFCLKLYLTWPWMFWWFSWLPKTMSKRSPFYLSTVLLSVSIETFPQKRSPCLFYLLISDTFPLIPV